MFNADDLNYGNMMDLISDLMDESSEYDGKEWVYIKNPVISKDLFELLSAAYDLAEAQYKLQKERER